MTEWRKVSPAQAMQAPSEQWARVRAVHAQWQLSEPSLRIGETARRLLEYGLRHVKEIEREQEALEVCERLERQEDSLGGRSV